MKKTALFLFSALTIVLSISGCTSSVTEKTTQDSTATPPIAAQPMAAATDAPIVRGAPTTSGISGTYSFSMGTGDRAANSELKVIQKSEKELKFVINSTFGTNTGDLEGTFTLSENDTFYTFINNDANVNTKGCGLKVIFHSDRAIITNLNPESVCVGGLNVQFDGDYKKMSRDVPVL